MYEVIFQVASLLSPTCNSMAHKSALTAHNHADFEALHIIAHVLKTMRPILLDDMKQASSGEQPQAKKRKIHLVLNVCGSTRQDTFYQGIGNSLRKTLEHEFYC